MNDARLMIILKSLVSILLLTGCLLAPIPVLADNHASTIVVATSEEEPFVIYSDKNGGKPQGAAVELVQTIAQDLGKVVKWEKYSNVDESLAAVKNGKADLAASAISVTPERAANTDFSLPYFVSNLGIAVLPEQEGGLMALFSLKVLIEVFGGFLAIIFAVGTLMWLVERRKNAQFPPDVVQGIGDGAWWAGVTMATVGYGDKVPITPMGRMIGFVWMFASIILISGFTANVTAALAVNKIHPKIQSEADLPHVRVGTIANTTAAKYLKEHGIGFKAYDDVEKMLEAVETKQIDAAVYYSPVLHYHVGGWHSGKLAMLETSFEKYYYAIAFPDNSPLRKAFDHTIMSTINSSRWNSVLGSYNIKY